MFPLPLDCLLFRSPAPNLFPIETPSLVLIQAFSSPQFCSSNFSCALSCRLLLSLESIKINDKSNFPILRLSLRPTFLRKHSLVDRLLIETLFAAGFLPLRP